MKTYGDGLKRGFDLGAALLISPAVVPVILLAATAIVLEDGGSPIYLSLRVGKNGELFRMYKLRTMVCGAPDIRNRDGSAYNGRDDRRLTRVGRILRRTSVDELPQLINVIKGDMSFVGPRPDLPSALQDYTDLERQKLAVRPGITGYNQAFFRNSASPIQRLLNDVKYSAHASFGLDCRIVGRTLITVISARNVFGKDRQYEREVSG